MDLTPFIICAIAVWRLTHLLSMEDGPFDIVFRLRKQLGHGFFGNLLDCFYCLSVWIAIAPGIWLGNNWKEYLVNWLAISGAACLLEKLTASRVIESPTYSEDKKN